MLQVPNLEVRCSTRTKTFSKKKLFSFEKFSKLPNKSTVIFLKWIKQVQVCSMKNFCNKISWMLDYIKTRAVLKSSIQERNGGFSFSKQLTKILSCPVESLECGRGRVYSIWNYYICRVAHLRVYQNVVLIKHF